MKLCLAFSSAVIFMLGSLQASPVLDLAEETTLAYPVPKAEDAAEETTLAYPVPKLDDEDAEDRATVRIECNGAPTPVSAGNTYQIFSPTETVNTLFGSRNVYFNNERCERQLDIAANTRLTMRCSVFRLLPNNFRNTCPSDGSGDRLRIRVEDRTVDLCGRRLDRRVQPVVVNPRPGPISIDLDFFSDGAWRDAGFQCDIVATSESADPGQTTTTTTTTTQAPGTTTTTTTTTTTQPSQGTRCQCGDKPIPNRIYNGDNAITNEWPWQAAVVSRGSSRPFCGGTLINDRTVLTAAHCVRGTSAGNIQVLLGEDNLNSGGDGAQRRSVSAIISHPNYNPQSVNFDYAILRLSTPVSYTNGVGNACLPPNNNNNFNGATAFATGWGETETGRGATVLQEAQMLVRGNCGSWTSGQITPQMICASGAANGNVLDTCSGDSGGPLVTLVNGRYTVIGVTSFGSSRGCANPNFPGVYARVSAVLPWIRSNANYDENSATCSG